MKLPDDSPFVILDCNMYGKRVGVRLTEDFVEWLVRDCAKVCASNFGRNPYPYADLAETCELDILNRYELEPK